MESSLLISLTNRNTQRRRGRHVMMTFKDCKTKFGPALAANMLAEKKKTEQNKPATDSNTYFMEHPEAPGDEESRCSILYAICWSVVQI